MVNINEKVAWLEAQLEPTGDPNTDPVKLVKQYVAPRTDSQPMFTGREFERFPGGGSPSDANRFTSADLAAVALLGVPLSGVAVLELLDDRDRRWSSLLSKIPVDADPSTPKGVSQLTDDNSAASRIWREIRRLDNARLGPTRTAKLLARKRPGLLPVYDSVVEGCVQPGKDWWRIVAAFYESEQRVTRLDAIREQAEATEFMTNLRTLDVVLWMRHREQ
jgi:hypothetical protein